MLNVELRHEFASKSSAVEENKAKDFIVDIAYRFEELKQRKFFWKVIFSSIRSYLEIYDENEFKFVFVFILLTGASKTKFIEKGHVIYILTLFGYIWSSLNLT